MPTVRLEDLPTSPSLPLAEYDFLILGGGTSGLTLAGRLASSKYHSDGSAPSILVIEAGPDIEDINVSPHVKMVGGLFTAMNGPLDWNFQTVPQKFVNGRILPLNRGKVLGGSSSFNGTLCIRGCKEDFDGWGLEGWSGDEVSFLSVS